MLLCRDILHNALKCYLRGFVEFLAHYLAQTVVMPFLYFFTFYLTLKEIFNPPVLLTHIHSIFSFSLTLFNFRFSIKLFYLIVYSTWQKKRPGNSNKWLWIYGCTLFSIPLQHAVLSWYYTRCFKTLSPWFLLNFCFIAWLEQPLCHFYIFVFIFDLRYNVQYRSIVYTWYIIF